MTVVCALILGGGSCGEVGEEGGGCKDREEQTTLRHAHTWFISLLVILSLFVGWMVGGLFREI